MEKWMSRRDFVASTVGVAGVMAASALFRAPDFAFAGEIDGSSGGSSRESAAQFSIVSEEELDAMWDEAVANARAPGGEVVIGYSPCLENVSTRANLTKKVQANITIGGIPDIVYIQADYVTSSDNTKITRVDNIQIYGFYSTLDGDNPLINYAIADGGRTLVVNASVVLRNAQGFAQGLKLHGEFGVTGGNFLTAAYV